MRDADWIRDVLHFWFSEVEPAKWFTRDERLDAAIGERFAAVYERVREMKPEEHAAPQAALAAVIVLDQFPRNMFRGSPRAFATDALALTISRAAIDQGFDQTLDARERAFLYMPWQHSEDRDVQARSVELFASLGETEGLDYARRHQDVIDRFGRFPPSQPRAPTRFHAGRSRVSEDESGFLTRSKMASLRSQQAVAAGRAATAGSRS